MGRLTMQVVSRLQRPRAPCFALSNRGSNLQMPVRGKAAECIPPDWQGKRARAGAAELKDADINGTLCPE